MVYLFTSSNLAVKTINELSLVHCIDICHVISSNQSSSMLPGCRENFDEVQGNYGILSRSTPACYTSSWQEHVNKVCATVMTLSPKFKQGPATDI